MMLVAAVSSCGKQRWNWRCAIYQSLPGHYLQTSANSHLGHKGRLLSTIKRRKNYFQSFRGELLIEKGTLWLAAAGYELLSEEKGDIMRSQIET